MTAASREHVDFPVRGPHRYELLVDGGEIFPDMLAAIAEASSHVLLEMYLWESGRVSDLFIEALCGAADRGIGVHLLLDDFGSRELSASDRERLAAHGVQLAWHNPLALGHLRFWLQRDHRKLLAVDGRVAFVGGVGVTDDFDPGSRGADAWHEVMLRIEGPCVGDWQRLFAAAWRGWHPIALELPAAAATQPRSGPPDGRVLGNDMAGGESVMRALIGAIGRARIRVWIATAYFVPTRRLRRALVRAARAGLDVRLLLPGPDTDLPGVRHAGRRFHGRLLRAGVRVFEYQPRCLHAKFAICDTWATVGSSNFDHWTLRWNLEANQEILGGDTVGLLAVLFKHDLDQCREHTLSGWRDRGWWPRLLERVYGEIDAALVRLGHVRGLRRRQPPASDGTKGSNPRPRFRKVNR
jgi:cardiolipin synthase A/B